MDFCLRVWLLPDVVLRCLLVVREDEGKGEHFMKRRGEPLSLQTNLQKNQNQIRVFASNLEEGGGLRPAGAATRINKDSDIVVLLVVGVCVKRQNDPRGFLLETYSQKGFIFKHFPWGVYFVRVW